MQIPGTMDLTNPTLTELANNTRLVSDFIRDETEQPFQRASKFHDRSAIVPRYKVGDQVLLHNEHVGIGEMRKMHKFYRLVTITAYLENYCYRVQDCTSGRVLVPFKIHASRLKPLTNEKMSQSTEHKSQSQQGQQQPQQATKARPTTIYVRDTRTRSSRSNHGSAANAN